MSWKCWGAVSYFRCIDLKTFEVIAWTECAERERETCQYLKKIFYNTIWLQKYHGQLTLDSRKPQHPPFHAYYVINFSCR